MAPEDAAGRQRLRQPSVSKVAARPSNEARDLKRKVRHDRGAYRRRNQVERFFGRMKEWSALALRRAKDDEVFLATI